MIRFGAELEDIEYEGQPSSVYFGLPMYEKVDVQAMIDAAIAAGESELTIPRGAYRITAREDASAHILLKAVSDFTIHAYDVVFLYQDFRKCGMSLVNCHNVTVEGLSTDFEPAGQTQMCITYIDPDGEYLEGHVDEGYMTEWNDMYGYSSYYPTYFYDGTTHQEIKHKRSFLATPKNIEMLGDRKLRVRAFLASDIRSRLRVGDYVIWGCRYIMRSALTLYRSGGVHIKNYTVWSGLCGVGESGSSEKNFYDGFNVMPGPRPYKASEDRVFCTTADAAHMSDNRVGATMENGIYHTMGDDGVNFYGYFTRVAEVISDTEFVLAIKERGSLAYMAGEVLRFYDEGTEIRGVSPVAAIEPMPKGYQPAYDLAKAMGASRFVPAAYFRVTLQKSLKLAAGDYISNTNHENNGFVLRNNKYFNSKARGVLIKASNGLVENCLFEDCLGGLVIRPELDWCESGYSCDIVVRNNTFIRCGTQRWPALCVTGHTAIDQRNILIENNDFLDTPLTEMLLSSCRGVTVRGNRFTKGSVRPEQGKPTVIVGTADGVRFENNQFDLTRVKVGVSSLARNIEGVEPLIYSIASEAVPRGKQGYDGWHFGYAPIGTNTYIDYPIYRYETQGPDGWHVEDGNDEDYGRVLAWWWNYYMCPGEKADVVKTYVCPYDGEVAISAHHDCMTGEPTADGVRVMVLHNDDLLWETTLQKMELIMPPTLIREVKKGDEIHFRVNKIESAKNDGLDWDPTVLYHAVN